MTLERAIRNLQSEITNRPMPIEIEKKYRLTKERCRAIEDRLRVIGAEPRPIEFEENTLYRGGRIDFGGCALRLRRVDNRAILTFKRRFPTASAIKHQQEDETQVADPNATDAILRALGFQPALIYEKRRTRWKVGAAEVTIDELPFGLFMEIEAPEKEIERVEQLLDIGNLPAVMETYPALAMKLGEEQDGVIEARFNDQSQNRSRPG